MQFGLSADDCISHIAPPFTIIWLFCKGKWGIIYEVVPYDGATTLASRAALSSSSSAASCCMTLAALVDRLSPARCIMEHMRFTCTLHCTWQMPCTAWGACLDTGSNRALPLTKERRPECLRKACEHEAGRKGLNKARGCRLWAAGL